MNQHIKRVRVTIVGGLVLVISTGLPAIAQDGKSAQFKDARSGPAGPAIVVAAKPARFDATKVQANTRAAIPFKPFDRTIDPRTGKAITPGSRFVLRKGKTVTATEYFDALDAAEKSLNAQGHSLREKQIVLKQVVTSKELLAQQKRTMMAGGVSPATNPVPGKQLLTKLQLEAQQSNNKVNAILQHLKPSVATNATAEKNFPWSYEYGDPATFYAAFSGNLDLKSTTGSAGTTNKVTGEIVAKGAIFHAQEEMLRGTGSMTTQTNGNAVLNLKVDVLGNTIYNNNKTVPAGHWYDSVSKGFDWSTTLFDIDLGFGIKLDATIGVKGTSAAEFALTASTTDLGGYSEGYAQGNIYGSAAIKAGDVAEAGVQANMLLAFLKMDQTGWVGLKPDANNQLCLRGYANLSSEVKMLKGKVYAYATFGPAEYDYTLWEDPGFSWSVITTFDKNLKCIN